MKSSELMALYPRPCRSFILMMPDEYEKYFKDLVRYWMVRYADELQADGFEINMTVLVEFAVDSLYHDEDASEGVWKWLDDSDHWIWDLSLEVKEKFEND